MIQATGPMLTISYAVLYWIVWWRMGTHIDSDKLVGKRIRSIRTMLGLSQSEFAEWLQQSRSVVSKIETGRRMAQPREIFVICQRSRVSSDWVLGLAGGVYPKALP